MSNTNTKTYSCGICKTTPDQISHHKSHIETQKHMDKKELFELKLAKLSIADLEEKYKTDNINVIINETETILYCVNIAPENKKKSLYKKLKTGLDKEEPSILESNNNTVEMNQIIEQSNSISNKEALKDKIHEINNYLRNNGAGYGMNALKVFNVLYGLKKIEEHGLFQKVNLTSDCRFSYLLELANENKDEQLAELIFGNVLESICKSELKEILFYEIPTNIRGYVFTYIIKEINRITLIEKTCNVQISGKIYEYFIGRDESAISELGAYFTNRNITSFILKELNPEKNADGTIPTMIDMFGGSGGLTTEYINYLNSKYPQLINWTTEIRKISHFDMNEDVIKYAGLEFFCLTGVLPNMENLKYKNSFTDEFNDQKYKFVLTNPPYGGDKVKKTEAQIKREKVKKYITKELASITDDGLRIKRQQQIKSIQEQEKVEKKELEKNKVCVATCSARIQKFAKKNKLKGNDKESCSLMLLMDIVEVDGTVIGVLKEGVFFSKMYTDLRRYLLENYRVRKIISVPQHEFENTETKTSIIIFDNSEEKTKEIEFSDLTIELYDADKYAEILGNVVLVENEGDIKSVRETLINIVSKEEILGNALCSLNEKDYSKNKIVAGEGYKLVKIKDICSINKNTGKLTKDEYNAVQINNVDYNSVTSFKVTKKAQLQGGMKNTVKMQDIFISCVRPNKNKIVYINDQKIKNCDIDNYVFTTALVKLEATDKTMAYVVYAMLYCLADTFEKTLCKASQYPRFKPTALGDVFIPIPTSQEKMEYWTNKLLTAENEDILKQYIQELGQEAMPLQGAKAPVVMQVPVQMAEKVPATEIIKIKKVAKKIKAAAKEVA